MKITNYLYTFLLSILLLSGCATVSMQQHVSPLFAASNQNALQHLQSWQLQAAIAVRSPAKNFTASLNWQQQQQTYNLYLFGPLGLDSIKIIGNSQQVTLQTADDRYYYAKNAEQLLMQQTGWQLPISSLYYWIRGVAVPGVKASLHWDTATQSMQLQQLGWQINYLTTISQQGLVLPRQIVMVSPSLHVRIVISSWRI